MNAPSMNIGYTLCNLVYQKRKPPRAKRKGVYGFQGDLDPVGPEGSSYKVFILWPIKSFLSLATKLRVFLSLASKAPSN